MIEAINVTKMYPKSVWLITPPDPIGPNQPKSEPTGPNRTTPHSTLYFLPPTPGQSLILSLAYTWAPI